MPGIANDLQEIPTYPEALRLRSCSQNDLEAAPWSERLPGPRNTCEFIYTLVNTDDAWRSAAVEAAMRTCVAIHL